jgi:hypothetical protein
LGWEILDSVDLGNQLAQIYTISDSENEAEFAIWICFER